MFALTLVPKQKSNLNIDLLEATARRIADKDYEFAMPYWQTCIAGHAVELYAERMDCSVSIGHRNLILGLNHAQARKLFDMHHWPERQREDESQRDAAIRNIHALMRHPRLYGQPRLVYKIGSWFYRQVDYLSALLPKHTIKATAERS